MALKLLWELNQRVDKKWVFNGIYLTLFCEKQTSWKSSTSPFQTKRLIHMRGTYQYYNASELKQ